MHTQIYDINTLQITIYPPPDKYPGLKGSICRKSRISEALKLQNFKTQKKSKNSKLACKLAACCRQLPKMLKLLAFTAR